MDAEVLEALKQLQAMTAQLIAKSAPKSEKKVAEPKSKKPVAPHLVSEFIEWFIKSPEDALYAVKRGQWECIPGSAAAGVAHTLVFHTRVTKNIKNAANVICIRPIGSKRCIFNASRIAYGTSWAAQKDPQAVAEAAGAIPIPFETVASTDPEIGVGLDLTKLELVDWKGAEKLIIPPVNADRWANFHVVQRHFAGATVVKVGDKYFLFDADRNELKHCKFNPFFTQLPCAVKTVEEAYEALMPVAVKTAAKGGGAVLRQGELFFVPVTDTEIKVKLGINGKPVDQFFYDQLCARIDRLAQIKYNNHQAELGVQVRDFIDRNALIPDSRKNASTELAPLRAKLAVRVGPKDTQPQYKDAEEERGLKTVDTVVLQQELNNRLPRRPTEKLTGGVFPFYLDCRVGEDTGNRQGRNHEVTAMYSPGDIREKNPELYVRGYVYHRGREHYPLYAGQWYRVYPNTATNNWTVHGDVD